MRVPIIQGVMRRNRVREIRYHVLDFLLSTSLFFIPGPHVAKTEGIGELVVKLGIRHTRANCDLLDKYNDALVDLL